MLSDLSSHDSEQVHLMLLDRTYRRSSRHLLVDLRAQVLSPSLGGSDRPDNGSTGGRDGRDLPLVPVQSANTPFWTRPSCAKALVVPDGFETNRKPRLLEADHAIVALVVISSPVEPGVLTGPELVAGPVHLTSKLHVASVDTGTSNRKRAFGMSK